MKQILVSACLLGLKTRYDGSDELDERLREFMQRFVFIPVCPEILGGLSIPRPPATMEKGDGALFWERGGKVVLEDGSDVSDKFRAGAERTFEFAQFLGISAILSKEGSPSCGVHETNVSFNRTRGIGITAFLLKKRGCTVDSVDSFLKQAYLF
jgi:uncharacterized protein YbbK (DUF523 family)